MVFQVRCNCSADLFLFIPPKEFSILTSMNKMPSKTRCIGILTSGGDCPGLNAAIRGVAKAAMNKYGIKVVGIQDGFRGLVENRTILLDDRNVSGLLTMGGTILGTSRDKPHKMPMGGKKAGYGPWRRWRI